MKKNNPIKNIKKYNLMDQMSRMANQYKSIYVTFYCYANKRKQSERWNSNYSINVWWHILKEEEV